MSLWDLGGAKQFTTMLPMVCVDAVAMLFLFSLDKPESLDSVKEWYRQVRALNQVRAPPFSQPPHSSPRQQPHQAWPHTLLVVADLCAHPCGHQI